MNLQSLLIATLFSGFSALISAQTAAPEVFASSGSGGGQSFTIGEVFTSTFEIGSPQLTQGFQQVLQVPDVVTEEAALLVSVYPNPANAFISVEVPDQSGPWLWQLHDIRGRIIRSGTLATSTQLPLADVSRGVYTLTIRAQDAPTLHTFRIVKLDL